MPSDLEVDADGLRACAAALAVTAADVHAGLEKSSPHVPRAPGWATAEAASVLLAAATAQFDAIAHAIAATGHHVTTAAVGYEAADDRAAARLRAGR